MNLKYKDIYRILDQWILNRRIFRIQGSSGYSTNESRIGGYRILEQWIFNRRILRIQGFAGRSTNESKNKGYI